MTFPLYMPAAIARENLTDKVRAGKARDLWEKRSKWANANLGLVFDKFFGLWNVDFAEREDTKEETAETKWVKQIVKARPTESLWRALDEATSRQTDLVKALCRGRTDSIWYAVATSRFVTGLGIDNPLENGFTFHHTLGVPYLAASGLKGGIKSYWEQWSDKKAGSREMLGTALGAGAVIFFDMLPVEPVGLVPEVMTPHYSEWYLKGDPPGDWLSPTPIPFIAVEAGAIFQIAVAPRVFRDPNWDANRAELHRILGEALDITGLGAKTAIGYGRFLLCDTLLEAKVAADEIKTALRIEWTPPAATRGSRQQQPSGRQYSAGDTLPIGTKLTWDADGDVFEVRTRTQVTIAPRMKIPVAYDGQEDDAPLAQIVELRHLK